MEKYAVIKLGGKQFLVEEGTQFKIERQESLKPEVLLYSDGKKVSVGEPVLTDVSVKMEFVKEDAKAPKIRVARFRSKSRHRRVKGHQQPISIVKVASIGTVKTPVAKPKAAAKKKAPVKTAAKKTVKSSKKEAK